MMSAGMRPRVRHARAHEEKCQRLEKRLDKAREAHDAASAAARRLADTGRLEDAATAGDELVALERELGKIDDRLRALTTEIPALSEKCKADEEHGEEWRELSATHKEKKKGIDRALKALDRNSHSKAVHAKVQDAYERALAADQEVSSLREATADTAHLKTELEKQIKRVETAKKDLGTTEQELRQLAFDTERLAAIKDAAENADTAREGGQDALTQARLDAQSRSSEVKALQDRLAESKKIQEAIDAKTTEVRQHEVAADLLSKYRDQQAKRAWPRLEQVASTLLSAATDGRYADVKLSHDYRLMIVDRGEDHELARFSGGEQDLANLCLRLSIADWVSKERNVELGFVVLDEVFGSQDDERRQRLLGELRILSNRFRQMLVITHISDIAELCDAQVEVSLLEPGRSLATLI
jgi:exonuclease SbcC